MTTYKVIGTNEILETVRPADDDLYMVDELRKLGFQFEDDFTDQSPEASNTISDYLQEKLSFDLKLKLDNLLRSFYHTEPLNLDDELYYYCASLDHRLATETDSEYKQKKHYLEFMNNEWFDVDEFLDGVESDIDDDFKQDILSLSDLDVVLPFLQENMQDFHYWDITGSVQGEASFVWINQKYNEKDINKPSDLSMSEYLSDVYYAIYSDIMNEDGDVIDRIYGWADYGIEPDWVDELMKKKYNAVPYDEVAESDDEIAVETPTTQKAFLLYVTDPKVWGLPKNTILGHFNSEKDMLVWLNAKLMSNDAPNVCLMKHQGQVYYDFNSDDLGASYRTFEAPDKLSQAQLVDVAKL